MNALEELRQIEMRGDNAGFHRRGFDYLLDLWNGRQSLPEGTAWTEYLPVLARWLRAAPLKEPQDRFRLLTARKGLLSLVHASGTNVDSFLESALGPLQQLEKAAPWVRQKLALMASIDSRWVPDLAAWQRIAADEVMTYIIAAVTDEPISPTGLKNFNALVEALPGMKPVDLPYSYLADLSYANYIVGFATAKDKYAGKSLLGDQVRRLLDKRGILSEMRNGNERARSDRPRIAVIAEKMLGGNMMHRCYGQQIAELKRDFDVTLIAEAPSKCQAHADLAHHVRYFDPHPEHLGALIRMVLSAAPEIVYYPSVGMTPWTFALSHLRLAPLQVASLGHPCPTASRVMDFLAVPREVWSPDAARHELALLYDAHPLAADFSASPEVLRLHERWAGRSTSQRIRVAINASSMKLNAEFLATVRRISDRAGGRLQLRFFPSGVGVRHRALEKRLQAWFPDAEVMEATDFGRYLGLLADCDLALQAFPFGGTNTTVDSLILGLPIVCLDGAEIHSRIDSAILGRAGLARALLATTVAEYEALALHLIEDGGARLSLGRMARKSILATLDTGGGGTTFADALKDAWKSAAGSHTTPTRPDADPKPKGNPP